MTKVLLLKSDGNYGALGLHIDQLHKAFVELGHDADIAVIGYVNSDEFGRIALPKIAAFKPDLIISIHIGFEFRHEGKSLSDIAGVPHICMFLDHPTAQWQRISAATKMNGIVFLDESHTEFTRKYLPLIDNDFIQLLPPGGNVSPTPAPIDTSVEMFVTNRNIPVLFTGSYHDYTQTEWKSHKLKVAEVLGRAVTLSLENDLSVPHTMLEQALKEVIGNLEDEQIEKWLMLSNEVNNVVHGRRRFEAMKLLAKAKIPVVLCGNGWAKKKYKLKGFDIREGGSFVETLELLKRTQLVFNSNTNFVQGGHERVFAAQMGGAAVISDYSTWYDNNYTENEIALFKWTNLKEMPDKINELLKDPEKMFNLAQAGRVNAEKNHRWENRAKSMINLGERIMTKRNHNS